ncbi:MAG: aminodeoxychorismate/anthranilate synthase component II [Bacteroidia bacterium]
MNILVLDNYDSFTFNLVHLVEMVSGTAPVVFRNDEVDTEAASEFDKIILSPGPGIPSEAGVLLPMIRRYAREKPILGVCLGHQAIGEAFGASLLNLESVFHGVATDILTDEQPGEIFSGFPSTFKAGRYHSWVIDPLTLPAELRITATDRKGNIMAIEHQHLPVYGVQFHPESIMTEYGLLLMKNFIFNH